MNTRSILPKGEPTPKQRVLEWVRSKNPQTMEHEFIHIQERSWCKHCRDCLENCYMKRLCVGSDMGLQELLIAIGEYGSTEFEMSVLTVWFYLEECTVKFDLTKNLHNQPDSFYESILPLIPND